jgi:hypothetical protein
MLTGPVSVSNNVSGRKNDMTAQDRLSAIRALAPRTGLLCPKCNGRLVFWKQWIGHGVSGAKAYCCLCQQHFVRGNYRACHYRDWVLLVDVQDAPGKDRLEAMTLEYEELALALKQANAPGVFDWCSRS